MRRKWWRTTPCSISLGLSISNEGKSWIQFSPLSGRNWKDGWFMVKEETRCLLSLMSLLCILENEDTSTVLSISGIQYRSSFKTVSSSVAKILAPCLIMTKILETEFWGNRKGVALLFWPGKTETYQASSSRTVTPFLGNRERFYILLKVLHFFSFSKFQNDHSWHQTTSLCLVPLKLSAHDLFSEM